MPRCLVIRLVEHYGSFVIYMLAFVEVLVDLPEQMERENCSALLRLDIVFP